MSQMSLSDWRTFLRARIEQEQGKDERALRHFDELLERYPKHPHLLASRTIALQRLGRDDEAIVGQIATKYAALGRTLVGEQDKPELWTTQLSGVLADADEFEKSGRLAAALIAW